MNWAQFKDPVSHMCLVGAVVASRSLTQEVAGSSPFTVMTNIFCHSVKHLGKTPVCHRVCSHKVATHRIRCICEVHFN